MAAPRLSEPINPSELEVICTGRATRVPPASLPPFGHPGRKTAALRPLLEVVAWLAKDLDETCI